MTDLDAATPIPGLTPRSLPVAGGTVQALVGGRPDGPPVVLLAGFPQTSYAWRHVVPLLAQDHAVIALDLPGQGGSLPWTGGADMHAVASALHEAVAALGVGPHWLVGHDVGAWAAFTYALDFPADLRGVALLDAGIPGVTMPTAVPLDAGRVHKTWHFAFHMVADLPETLLAGREAEYVGWFLRTKAADAAVFDDAEIAHYAAALAQEGSLTTSMGYYRSASESAEHNRQLLARGPLAVPVLAVDSEHGSIPDMASPLRAHASTVTRATIPGAGHFIPEEQPALLAAELAGFFAGAGVA